jgi:hypothetical protein
MEIRSEIDMCFVVVQGFSSLQRLIKNLENTSFANATSADYL